MLTIPINGLGEKTHLWDEFEPFVYHLTAIIKSDYGTDTLATQFGMREFRTDGRMFSINGRKTMLRGTVENCDFPLTGYPPMDVESWERVFRQCKAYGLNHMRFHSYCPPEAAFVAADRLGFYLQPEGPSWPNHGVKLGGGMPIDEYLADECRAILDTYGHHPSFVMLAAGNEPAGNWVKWGVDFVRQMKAHDPSRIYCTASVGGGWEWDYGSEYHVKGGARGLEWNRRQPSANDNYAEAIRLPRNFRPTDGQPENNTPILSHEQGQWCAFPDFKEIPQYTGAYKAANFEIFRDLLATNGMASQAEKFLMSSGRLQVLAYKYEIERHLRTPGYAGFQLLALNDYSGQGTALVGPLNVHWREKGYCTAADWREFCSDLVPLAHFPRFTFETTDTLRIPVTLYDATSASDSRPLSYAITNDSRVLMSGTCMPGETITFIPSAIDHATKLTLTIHADANHKNHWDFWVYTKPTTPDSHPALPVREGAKCIRLDEGLQPAKVTTPSLAGKAGGESSGGEPSALDSILSLLEVGRDVLLCAGGQIKYGRDVVHRFLPVFWNTSWFKMKPPHTTGAYIQADHPIFRDFPTDDWQDLQWWELTNRAQCINLAEFPKDFQPIVQPIDTWHLSRKLGMLLEARVGKGRLILTTFDLTSDLDHRIVARQLRHSILRYMQSPDFRPTLTLSPEILHHLFDREAPAVDMFTRESPDELKPKFAN